MGSNYAAAYAFRYEDLYDATGKKLISAFTYFQNQLVYIESTNDQRYHLFADLRALTPAISQFGGPPVGEIWCEAFSVDVPVHVLTADELTAGQDPETAGLVIKFRIQTDGAGLAYDINVFEDDLGNLDIDDSDVLSPKDTSAEEKENKLSKPKKFFIGARRKDNPISVNPISPPPAIEEWIDKNFPDFRRAVVNTLFPDVRLIDDAHGGVVTNVQLYGDIQASWELRTVHTRDVDMLVIGSEVATLITPECPTIITRAYVDPAELESAKKSVKVGAGTATFDDIQVKTKNTLSADYKPAIVPPQHSFPVFMLWLSKDLLSKTFDGRVGDKLAASLGFHTSDRSGAIKWYLAGSWLFKGYQGSLSIDTTSAKLKVRLEGGTKFEALSYVDIGCVSYKLGDMDAFHEDFDFSVNSSLFVSNTGELMFVGDLDDLYFAGWHCFIDTFLERYNSSWNGIIAEIVIKYIIGVVIQDIVEGRITDAMGYLTMNFFDIKKVPIAGDRIMAFGKNPSMLAANVQAYDNGIEILVGVRG